MELKMGLKKCCSTKVLFLICNCLFLMSGLTLAVAGLYLFLDTRRILLSRLLLATDDPGGSILSNLPRPLFYYVALVLIVLGLVTCSAALVGCAASCAHNYCVLTIYILLVIALLIFQGLVYSVLSLWPNCLGLGLDTSQMVRTLQRNYGVPGQEQFTAAMDLAQTIFQCCAINDSINYDTSLWRLQGLGHRELAVPLTCCHLGNARQKSGYLDPQPVNITLCQALAKEENQYGRYQQGCLPAIEEWYEQHYTIFLAAGLFFIMIEFAVLVGAILTCAKVPNHRKYKKETLTEIHPISANVPERMSENIYQDDLELPEPENKINNHHLYRKNLQNLSYRSANANLYRSYRGFIV